MSDEDKLAFKAKIASEASARTEEEKKEYRDAIMANVLEIKEKILEIKQKVEKHTVTDLGLL